LHLSGIGRPDDEITVYSQTVAAAAVQPSLDVEEWEVIWVDAFDGEIRKRDASTQRRKRKQRVVVFPHVNIVGPFDFAQYRASLFGMGAQPYTMSSQPVG